MNNPPSAFVEPVDINGRTFEKSDVPAIFYKVRRIILSANNKPAKTKKSAAKFLLAVDSLGLAKLSPTQREYFTRLVK